MKYPGLSTSITVEFNRPGAESSLRPRLGTPKEWSTSLLVTTSRLNPPNPSATGKSKAPTLSNSSLSNRMSYTSVLVSLCQFHWLLTILLVAPGTWSKTSCMHNKRSLGAAIVNKIKIGIIVHVDSKTIESGKTLPFKPQLTLTSIKTTKIKITLSQTIIKSCKLSKNL